MLPSARRRRPAGRLGAHLWREQGLIDKRTADDPGIRVPPVMHRPDMLPKGRVVAEIAANIDIAPTVLEAAGVPVDRPMHGRSRLPLAKGAPMRDWRSALVDEYFWERSVPSTLTLHALITPRWKYVRSYGLWDVPERYDLATDPHGLHSFSAAPEQRRRGMEMDARLFERLAETGGMALPDRRAG